MTGGAIGVRGRLGELHVALERLFERDGIRLRVDDDPLVVGDRSADVRVGPLDRGERHRIGRHRVGYSLALDQPHIATRRGDDQAIGLEHRNREEVRQRPGHAMAPSSTGSGFASSSGAASRTSPNLSGRVGGASCLAARR